MNNSLKPITAKFSEVLLKRMLLSFVLLSIEVAAAGQTESLTDKVIITSLNQKTQVRTNENGELQVNVSQKDVHK